MRVYKSNGILKLEPESKEERKALDVLYAGFRRVPASWKVKAGIVSDGCVGGDDEGGVVPADKGAEKVDDMDKTTESREDSLSRSPYELDPEQVAVLRKVLDEGGKFEGFFVCDRDTRFDPPKPQRYFLSPFAIREIVYNLSQEYGQA